MTDRQAGQGGSESDVWDKGGFPTKPILKRINPRKLVDLISRRSAKRQSAKRQAGA
jgi:hypothetical protein